MHVPVLFCSSAFVFVFVVVFESGLMCGCETIYLSLSFDLPPLSSTGNLIGPVVTNVIEGRKLTTFIRLPTGCGEQNMVNLAPNVFVLQYLRTTKQVTPQIETNAFNFIRSGKVRIFV